jgi:hypothetical protein
MIQYQYKQIIREIENNDIIFISLSTGFGVDNMLDYYIKNNNLKSAFIGHRIIANQYQSSIDYYIPYTNTLDSMRGKLYDIIIININKKAIYLINLLQELYLHIGKKIIFNVVGFDVIDDIFNKKNDLCDYSFYHKKCMRTITRKEINNLFSNINIKLIDKINTLQHDRKKKMKRIIN